MKVEKRSKRKILSLEFSSFRVFCYAKILKDKKITAYRLSKNGKIDTVTLHHWLAGVHIPNIENLFRLADALDCTADYLIGREL